LTIFWTVATVLLAVVEAITPQFVSIWFAGGAFVSLIAAVVGLRVWWQVIVFFVTSAILLLLTRPFIKKLRKKGNEKTNSDSLIGINVPVYEKISNINSHGAVKIRDVVWSARSEDDEEIEEGTIVTVTRIEGVRLFVKVKED